MESAKVDPNGVHLTVFPFYCQYKGVVIDNFQSMSREWLFLNLENTLFP